MNHSHSHFQGMSDFVKISDPVTSGVAKLLVPSDSGKVRGAIALSLTLFETNKKAVSFPTASLKKLFQKVFPDYSLETLIVF